MSETGRRPRRRKKRASAPVRLNQIISNLLKHGRDRIGAEMARIPETDVAAIIYKAREIFAEQPMLVELDPPIQVLGDIHGDLQTLVQIFEEAGHPNRTNYLFLGDYVDRGKYGFEVIMLLLCFKILRPKNFFLLRGNHEDENVTRNYGFMEEMQRKQSPAMFKLMVGCFNQMPVAALIADQIFCCHGGISFNMQSMDDIANLPRPTAVPNKGLMCDLLWSDPSQDIDGWAEHKRGAGYAFGKKALREWMDKHDVTLVIRAHQVVLDGYLFFDNRRLVTVFSAPNYTNDPTFSNRAGMISIGANLELSVVTLEADKKTAGLIWGENKRR